MRLAALFLLLTTSCASVGLFQSADTLGRGTWEVGAEVSAQATTGFDSVSLFPLFGVSARVGVHDKIDVGGRIGPAGVELTGKFMLTERNTSGPIVSLAPAIGGTFSMPSGLILGSAQASLPVLIGIPITQRVQLIFAPRIHDSLAVLSAGSTGGTANTIFLGGAVGVSIRVWRLKIIPDVGVLAPIATTTWRSDVPPGTVWGDGRWNFQVNVAVVLGSSREADHSRGVDQWLPRVEPAC